ncbi:Riboflavin kinase [Arcticibacter svalbardensis MN12-7]|uniref:Riboflavin biosynthesis protein n=1 Tax=Arcticibacter svalbardensis MN12-7 TaxID=1150600 RepID=R9GVN2_9SPHI|nr:bifunctional riboflavin kinase/FAD synthetase [Arcticibacter svalbardensis]EOR95580.1 Riboflavin kinase [Arcticibacter svalbardensis MN12-7]
MKVYRHIDEFVKLDNAIVTIGTFDGVHLGHRKIISRLVEEAKRLNGQSVILTFFPHPRMILHPEDQSLKLITTIDEKIQQMEKLGVDHLIITPFTRDFSNLSPDEYIHQILVDKIGTKKIIIGYDHHFGKDRQGNFLKLEECAPLYHFSVEEITEQDIHDVAVSSTKVRQALTAGDVKTAEEFLGYAFQLTGQVIKGDQIGRTIGFPTANLYVEETYKLIPADGIYAVLIEFPEEGTILQGMGYIGNRPTINGMSRNIEVNIFDFNKDIYGKKIRIHFLHFIRGDLKFHSLQKLTEQIKQDQITALQLLN